MFLAGKFPDHDDRIAAVLPASMLNKTSVAGVREMLMEEYTIEHIVAREDESNFSEDTELREILLIAKKGQPNEEASTSYINLNGLNINCSELTNTVYQANQDDIQPSRAYTGGGGEYSEFRIHRLPYNQLDTHDLFSPLAVQNFELFDLWGNVRNNDYLSYIEDMDTGLTGGSGGGIPYWNEGVFNAPHDYLRKDDVWVVDEDSEHTITATHKHTKESIEITKDALEPYFHRYAQRANMDISGLSEYTVVRDFDNIHRFLQIANVEQIPDGWEGHVDRRKAHLGIPDRFNFTAPGTRLLAYYSDEPRMYHRMWMFPDINKETSKALAVWMNSSIGVVQYLLQRIPYQGGWGKYHRHTLAKFKAPNPKFADIKLLTSAFEDIGSEDFPSLIEQVVRNANPETMNHSEKHKLELHFEDVSDTLGDGFAPRRKMDEAVLDMFDFSPNKKEKILEKLYPALINEIIGLKNLM
jgi:hypothetical protein